MKYQLAIKRNIRVSDDGFFELGDWGITPNRKLPAGEYSVKFYAWYSEKSNSIIISGRTPNNLPSEEPDIEARIIDIPEDQVREVLDSLKAK